MTGVSSTRPAKRRPAAAPPRTGGSGRARPPARPAGTKPGGPRERRRPDESAEHSREREPRQITVRTLVLAIVVLLAFMLVAPTLGAYVRQQEQHRDLKADLTSAQDEAAALQAAVDRWNNDDFARNQARQRLGFVMPGETPYRVLDPETITGEAAPEESAGGEVTGPVPLAPSGPWYLTVWESTEAAGQSTGEVEP
ncbi:hypothetical protein GCE65_03490 [Pseudactinotalea sp. HY158]|nr:hypothetical protein GCE65_03490 [Pseudactinotalea sp. HY158]